MMLWYYVVSGLVASSAIVLVILNYRKPTFAVTRDGLRISNSFFTRIIPAAELRTSDAIIIDFAQFPMMSPKWRLAGFHFWRRQSGWYVLKNGERALLFLTRHDQIIYIPTNKGYSILLTPENPLQFLASMTKRTL